MSIKKHLIYIRVNYYRSDNVASTAYFYYDKPYVN